MNRPGRWGDSDCADGPRSPVHETPNRDVGPHRLGLQPEASSETGCELRAGSLPAGLSPFGGLEKGSSFAGCAAEASEPQLGFVRSVAYDVAAALRMGRIDFAQARLLTRLCSDGLPHLARYSLENSTLQKVA